MKPETYKCRCFHRTRLTLDWKRPKTCPDYNSEWCEKTERWWAENQERVQKEADERWKT